MMLASHEVRWFLSGGLANYPTLKTWVNHSEPLRRRTGVPLPAWEPRQGGKPDVYHRIPGHVDLSMKWREGQLQVKGLQCSLGLQQFGNGHVGDVQRWLKWSYKGNAIETAFRHWFTADAKNESVLVAVDKIRCLRKVRMDPLSGEIEEVGAKEMVDRGGNLEVTDLQTSAGAYCSVAFEAFPDDSEMHAAFTRFVKAFLETLTGLELSARNSLSYPAWLEQTHGQVAVLARSIT